MMPVFILSWHTSGTMMWRCMWLWRTPKEPQCCSLGSSSCSCRTWTCSPTTSASPWSCTITMTVSVLDPGLLKFLCVRVNTFASAVQSPQWTTNPQDSRRVNVTASGLRALQCTSGWARFKRLFIPWESVCQQKKVGWRSCRREIIWMERYRLPKKIFCQAKAAK